MNATKYKNVAFSELMSYAQKNPNRSRKLAPIEVRPVVKSNETSLDALGLRGYKAFNLNPSGILSLVACISNPSQYMLSPISVKSVQISELATELQQKTDALKNTILGRKRKRIHDLIGSIYNQARLDDKETIDVFHGIAFMKQVNFILMKSTVQDNVEEGGTGHKGEIVFSSNPINWSKETPVWVVDFKAHWVAIPLEQHTQKLHDILGVWLSDREQTGWSVNWPEVDGSKEEIVEQLSQYPTWNESDKSLKKEILAKRLGKAGAIRLFTGWTFNKIDTNRILEDSE